MVIQKVFPDESQHAKKNQISFLKNFWKGSLLGAPDRPLLWTRGGTAIETIQQTIESTA